MRLLITSDPVFLNNKSSGGLRFSLFRIVLEIWRKYHPHIKFETYGTERCLPLLLIFALPMKIKLFLPPKERQKS